MKLSKKQIGLIAGLACAILLIVLLLTMCNGSGYGDHQSESTEPSAPVESTAPVEESTEALDETTEATEESTEETEEPTEETTEPTTGSTGGNTRPGGTGGYNPGGSDGSDDDSSGGTVTEKAPAAGSENSPYVETVAQFPDAFASVQIPTDSTIYHHVYGADGGVLVIEDEEAYVIYNGITYEPDEYGVLQVPFAAAKEEKPEAPDEELTAALDDEADAEPGTDPEEQPDTEVVPEPEKLVLPQIFQLGSKSAEARSFLLSFQAPLGAQENPVVLEAFDGAISAEVSLEAGDENGYFYSHTAVNNGVMTLQVESITDNVECDIIVTVGEETFKLSECENGVLEVNLVAEETILIQVVTIPGEDGTYPAAEIKILGQIEDQLGSIVNPIMIAGEFPIVTDVLEPEAEVYYSVYGAGGMILSIADPDAYVIIGEDTWTAVDGIVSGEVVSANPREPVLIGIGNGGEAAESYTVEFQYKLGTMMNPDSLVLNEINTAVFGENSTDGYWYTWTAEEEGILTLTMLDSNWMYLINNETASIYGDTQYSDSEEVFVIAETEVAAGDVLTIMVSTYDPAEPFVIPAGELKFDVFFSKKPGTEENPIWLTEEDRTVEVQSNKQVYCYVIYPGVDVVVTGEGNFAVTYNGVYYLAENGVVTISDATGTPNTPDSLVITNYSDKTVTYTVDFVHPLGSDSNPHIIDELGEYTAAVQGDDTGYFYSWTALTDGEFTITMLGDDWTFVVNNTSTYVYGDRHVSSDGDAASETISVAAGNVLQINVSTASRQEKNVSMVVDFYDPTYGTADNPAWPVGEVNSFDVRPGTTMYINVGYTGSIMTVTGPDAFELTYDGKTYVSENGAVVIENIEGTRFMPEQLILTNSGEEKTSYNVVFTYPLGSGPNPEEITELGEYTAVVETDSTGYFYTWKADADGVFAVSIQGDDWTYAVGNLTTNYHWDTQRSADGSPSSMTFEVKKDEELQIVIGTSSGNARNITLEFDAYDPNFATEENPSGLTDLVNTLVVRPNAPAYLDVFFGGTNMTITAEGQFTVIYDGMEYASEEGTVFIPKLEASRFTPKRLILTNPGEKKISYTVEFAYPTGTSMNPEIITQMGEHTASVVGDGEGYFYTWFAEADGEFTITMLSDDWVYVMHNLTGYHYGGFWDSLTPGVESETISVKAGDEIQINIGTVSRQDKDVTMTFSFRQLSEEKTAEIAEFTGIYSPKPFEVNMEEEVREMGPVALTQCYELVPSKAGIYHLHTKSGPLALLDFTDDTYVNLKELVESTELTIPVTGADGTVTMQSCNALLKRYIDCAWVLKVSDEKTMTLYPLTVDLENILKSLGEQLGWFDPDSDGYLFAEKEQPEEVPETEDAELTDPPAMEQESLWMFACSYIEFIMDEEEPAAEESMEAPAEELAESDETTETSDEADETITVDSEIPA